MNTRLVDRARSRIVLVGAPGYDNPSLPDVPQIARSLADLAAVFTDPGLGAFPACNCITTPPDVSVEQVGDLLHNAAREAEDLLLFYFVGHGLVGPRGELYLGLRTTRYDNPAYSALRFETVRDTFLDPRTKAKNRVFIVDSCFSGRGLGEILSLKAAPHDFADELEISGTYTLTSSPPNSVSLARENESHTAFTGHLISLLREGDEDAGPMLSLGRIYQRLHATLRADGLPLPQQRGTNTADQLGLVANRKADSTPTKSADSVTTLGPGALEVHYAVLAGDGRESGAELTPYLLRRHDHELRKELAGVLAGEASRLIMLTGGSSTGKTRALYEALVELAPSAPLLHPVGKQALLELLTCGRITPGCVLWLNEAQRFLYGDDGQQAAVALRAVLESTSGIAVLGTLWSDPYWNELTVAAPGDPHSQSRALLTHPSYALRLHVPDHLSAQDQSDWRNLVATSGDVRLKQALAAGSGSGRVIQHLSGGPELLQAYLEASGSRFTPREYALLTAAIDARRMGHMAPLSADLLAMAADGDLSARDRAADSQWARQDLDALATGRRPDGSRTDIRETLTALTAVRDAAGSEPCYEPADYLDQHTRGRRADQRGSSALWQALIEHTSDPADLDRLARAAWDRGLRSVAVRLWHKAVAAGHPTTRLAQLDPCLDPNGEAAMYSAAHAELANPVAVAMLLGALRERKARQAITRLVDRIQATHVDLTAPGPVDRLLETLWSVKGEWSAVAEQTVLDLANYAAANVELTNQKTTIQLVNRLRRIGAEHAVAKLLERDAAHTYRTKSGAMTMPTHASRESLVEQEAVDLAEDSSAEVDFADTRVVARRIAALEKGGDKQAALDFARCAAHRMDLSDVAAVTRLLKALVWVRREQAEQAEQVGVHLAHRIADEIDFSDTYVIARLLEALWHLLWPSEAGQAVVMDLAGRAAAQADLSDLGKAAGLLHELGSIKAIPAAVHLARRAGAHANLSDPDAVARLLMKGRFGFESAEAVLSRLRRDPAAQVDVKDPDAVVRMLETLLKIEADHEIQELLDRNPAAEVDLRDPAAVAQLLKMLQKVGGEEALTILARRAAANVSPARPNAADRLLVDILREVGDEAEADALRARQEDAGHHPEHFAPHGREPDGRPTPPWTWYDLPRILSPDELPVAPTARRRTS